MKIHSINNIYTSALVSYIFDKLIKNGVSLSEAFPNVKISIGMVPKEYDDMEVSPQWRANLARPHYLQHKGIHFVTYPIRKAESHLPIDYHMSVLAHELGHAIHELYLGKRMDKWAKWSTMTGIPLDMGFLDDQGYPRVVNYENFANDFQKIVRDGCTNLDYYVELLSSGDFE